MRKNLLSILMFLLISSCKEDALIFNLKYIVEKFEQGNNTYFKDVRINLIRVSKNYKKAYYELRRSEGLGFAVFETRPHIVIKKNFYTDSISLDIVKAIDNITCQKEYLLFLLDNIDKENPKLEILNKNRKYTIFINDSIANAHSKLGNRVYRLNNQGKYISQEFTH